MGIHLPRRRLVSTILDRPYAICIAHGRSYDEGLLGRRFRVKTTEHATRPFVFLAYKKAEPTSLAHAAARAVHLLSLDFFEFGIVEPTIAMGPSLHARYRPTALLFWTRHGWLRDPVRHGCSCDDVYDGVFFATVPRSPRLQQTQERGRGGERVRARALSASISGAPRILLSSPAAARWFGRLSRSCQAINGTTRKL